VQPVELPAGWAAPALTPVAAPMAASAAVPLGSAPATFTAGPAGSARRAAPRRARARSLAGSPGRVTDQEPDLAAQLRDLAATEARRLERRPDSEPEMRNLLDDLATRLAAMLRHLHTLGADVTPLAAILELLRDQSVSTIQRWDRAQRALRELAARAD